jgi:hypothetical protein
VTPILDAAAPRQGNGEGDLVASTYNETTRSAKARSAKVGTDLLMGSLTLRCIGTALSIKTLLPMAAGL